MAELAMKPGAHVLAETAGADYAVAIRAGHHALVADEPVALGGGDAGASPFGLVLSGLAACTAITLRMYAARKGWGLEKVGLDLRYEEREGRVGVRRRMTLTGALDDAQRARLADIAERTPVTLAIKGGTPVWTEVVG